MPKKNSDTDLVLGRFIQNLQFSKHEILSDQTASAVRWTPDGLIWTKWVGHSDSKVKHVIRDLINYVDLHADKYLVSIG